MKVKLSDKIVAILNKTESYYNVDFDEGDFISLSISYHGKDNFICELRRPVNYNSCNPDLKMVAPNLGTESMSLLNCLNELNEILEENLDNCNLFSKEENNDTIVFNGKVYKFTGETR